jgi:hypothetical protein
MGEERKPEDRLREEYFLRLPEIRRVAEQLEAEIRFRTLPIQRQLNPHEQIVIKSRIKDCESAVKAIMRRKEGRVFDPGVFGSYSILDLRDLAGVRVLAFPHSRLTQVDQQLRACTCSPNRCKCFSKWTSDPMPFENGSQSAPKYWGYCEDVSLSVLAEYQVLPMLIGLFWEVEHSALYKPNSEIKSIAQSKLMQDQRTAVESALSNFELQFEKLVLDQNSLANEI